MSSFDIHRSLTREAENEFLEKDKLRIPQIVAEGAWDGPLGLMFVVLLEQVMQVNGRRFV